MFTDTKSALLYVLFCAVIPYLLGSLSFSIIVSRLLFRKDVRNYGSHNAGMTNVLRTHFFKKQLANCGRICYYILATYEEEVQYNGKMCLLRQGRDVWHQGVPLPPSCEQNLEAQREKSESGSGRVSPLYLRLHPLPAFR